MTKLAAFGTLFKLGDGALQVDTATVVGTVTGSGNATFTITAAGMTGSPLAKSVPVLIGDSAAQVAAKAIAVLAADSAISALFYVGGIGATVVLTRRAAVANDATLNIAFTNGTCTGLTPNATSANTVAGGGSETFNTVAQVTNIGGPGLSADTEDVTTHDQATAFEEHVVTLLRSGEVSLDLEFDPAGSTHGATAGLVAALQYKILKNCQVVFPGPYTWSFSAFVTGFEPSAAVDGALTASAKLKVSGSPVLV